MFLLVYVQCNYEKGKNHASIDKPVPTLVETKACLDSEQLQVTSRSSGLGHMFKPVKPVVIPLRPGPFLSPFNIFSLGCL